MRTVAFFSYTRRDDNSNRGLLSAIRQELEDLVQVECGETVELFQDVDDIKTGEEWRARLRRALDEAAYLIAVVTPSFFNSQPCREELGHFVAKAEEIGRGDLVLPVHWRRVPGISDAARLSADPLLRFMEARQWRDWTKHNYKTEIDIDLRREINDLAQGLADRLHRDEVRVPSSIPSDPAKGIEAPTGIDPSPEEDLEPLDGDETDDLDKPLTETTALQLRYWTALNEFIEREKLNIRTRTARPRHWTEFSLGRTGFWLTAATNTVKPRISAKLSFGVHNAKDCFWQLHEQRDQIEQEFGEHLSWEDLPRKKGAKVILYLEDANIADETDWPRQHRWISSALMRLDKVFRPRVRDLRADG